MNWIKELNKHGYNFLVDELVWHLEQGRMPITVAKRTKEDMVGFEFRFENEKPYFLTVNPDMLNKHWEEAQKIIADFPQLENVEYVVS
jgi:hypothetical protein